MADDVIFFKKNKKDVIWWVDFKNEEGRVAVSFDKKKIYNLFEDYKNFTFEQKALFDKENPMWAKIL